MSGLTVGSLFAGVGGFDLAAERAGMTVVWQSEYDKHASQVLDDHWPDIPNYGDIHDIQLRRLERGGREQGLVRTISDSTDRGGAVAGDDGGTDDGIYAAGVDVLVGGFPCQDYSVAGQRGGLAGDRGALWWQFHRLIAEGRPRWVVGENVPGLLSSRSGQDFGVIVDSLTELGYRVAWRVLDAQYFGVAQRRRRVFIVASLGAGNPSQVLAIAEGLSGHPQPSREEGTVTSALTANGLGGGGPDDNNAQANTLIPYYKSSMDAGWEPGIRTLRARDHKGDSHVVVAEGVDLFNQTLTGDQHVPLRTAGGHGAPAVLTAYPDPIPTLRAGQGGTWDPQKYNSVAFSQSQVRRLTPTECERLQGFPDGWTATQSDTQRYRQMGNAVAVPVAEWIMQRIAVL